MAFSVKQWFDRFGSGGSYDQPTDTGDVPDTPLDAAGQRDQETRLSAYTDSTVAAHTGAATAAHAASAISFSPTGSVGSTTAQAAIAEVASEAASALTSGLAGKADLSGGHVPVAQLASGTPDGTKFVRDDGTLAVPPGTAQSGSAALTTFTPAGGIAATDVQAALVEVDSEKLAKASNLSDLASAATARTNLGVASDAVAGTASMRTLGTGSTQAAAGDHTHVGAAGVDEAINTVGATGAAETIPAPTTATVNYLTLDANCTLTFPTAAAGRSFSLVLKQDATGSRTVTWPGTVQWAGGSVPTLTTTAAKRDVFTFICVDGTNWLGFVAGQNF